MRVHSDGAVGPLLLAAVGAASIVLLVVSVLYACASKEDDERAATAASTVGQEAAPSDQDAYLKQQIRLIEERKRREWEVEQAEKKRKKREEKEAAAAAEEEDVRRRRRKQREAQEKEEKARVIEIELAETKRAEEEQRRLQEERRIALETKAEEERVAREQKERQGAAEQEAEDFPDIHDEGIDCESGGASRAIQSIETTESMIKEMAAGTYSPRSSQKKAALTVNTSTRAKPERRLSAMDSPYGRMLLKSPRKSHQSVAQLLYGAYPGLGIEVMQAFLHKVGVEFETDLGLIEEDDVQNLDADEFDADTKEKLWKAVCKHKEKVGKKAYSLRKSIKVVDPAMLPTADDPAKDLAEWYARFEVPEETQATLQELGIESVDDVNFLEKSDLVDAGVDSEMIEIIMNAIAIKKLQDLRAAPRSRATM